MAHTKSHARHASHSSQAHSRSSSPIIEAAIEVGQAAESLKDSLDHVQKARKKGAKAIEPVKRAGKKAMHAVKKTVSRIRG